MMPVQPLLIAVASVLALAACSSAPSTTQKVSPPPATAPGPDQPAAGGTSVSGNVNTGGTYPYGTVQKLGTGASQETGTGVTEGVVVMGPDGTVWIRSDASDDEHYRTDVDSCYAYARAQVAHDVRIESDRHAAFESEAGGLGLAALRSQMDNFERSRRIPSLFNNCMASKGYSRQ